jgi:glutaredoxin
MSVPIVYTLPSCPPCLKLKEDWTAKGIKFEERPVNESQEVLDEELKYGDMVPIVVYPDGRVELGYNDMIGCAIV